ncbi:YkvA family protein [Jeotgalibacillus sp. JSM ZJ347]|uniref:YkvA family protein n=1 Tax=Jeotgalibacillus sp. JSM ZJ347 TaxID=3342117 RepID=UPI0035A8A384
MKFIKRIQFVFHFRKSLPFIKDFFTSSAVHPGKKLLTGGLIAAYAVIPADIIPDYLFLVGITDDIAFTTFMLQLAVKMAPPELREKHQLHIK